MKSAVLYFLLCFTTPVFAVTLKVSPAGKINSIQQAIQECKSNDTILVSAGTYREKNLVIEKPIVLLGKDMPVLDGENQYEIISVKSSGVVIDGFHFVRSGYSDLTEMAAIKIYYAHNVTIRNNFFDDTYFGIYNLSSNKCFILNNRFLSKGTDEMKSGNGIHCWRCDSMIITGNTVTGHRDGIYFEFVTNSAITNNHSMWNVRYGLHFMFSHSNRFEENI
ncbi:MAG TPA: NosD domain-containing protein, partial [Chitinophagales bacterium]|nr:NosD domain-containing protein [Chitinophagales bacterium]